MKTYKVVAYIGNDPYGVFAICTNTEYAENARAILIENGFSKVEITEMDYHLNTMLLKGKHINLTISNK